MSGTSTRSPPGRSNVNAAGAIAVCDPEPVEHLGAEQEVRREPAEVRRVVAWHERLDSGERRLDRHALDRDEATPHERGVGRVDDVQPVRERVQPERVQMELARMGRVAGEEPGVPVPRAEERDDPHDADEELVLRERRGAPRERAHLGLEPLARDAAERVRVNLLDRLAELTNVVCRRRRGGRTGLPRGGERDHGEWHEEQARHPHEPTYCPFMIDMSRLTY